MRNLPEKFACVQVDRERDLEWLFVAIAAIYYRNRLSPSVVYITPTNRFYGSTMFAPNGIGMSGRGYTSQQVILRSVLRFRAIEFPYVCVREMRIYFLYFNISESLFQLWCVFALRGGCLSPAVFVFFLSVFRGTTIGLMSNMHKPIAWQRYVSVHVNCHC